MGGLEIADDVLGDVLIARTVDPDRDVVDLARAGRTDRALRLLMHRHGVAVYRYCREELRDAMLADDVHQQVFIQAHRDLARFAGRATMRTWLFAIARNRVLDAAKARRRAMAHVEQDDSADAPDTTPSAGEQIDAARLLQALVRCVDKLGPSMRTAVLLRYQQGFTFAEMAVICGEKPGTLQARVTRALPLLRGCIEATTGGQL
ncbi:MAG TPA: sigma-70 family RNA polymerase sigma factor [Kofleriaceae bacterium]|nr:sigma-70 family RNA polymerase sigma factor [Kofleriaceae bacterium]